MLKFDIPPLNGYYLLLQNLYSMVLKVAHDQFIVRGHTQSRDNSKLSISGATGSDGAQELQFLIENLNSRIAITHIDHSAFIDSDSVRLVELARSRALFTEFPNLGEGRLAEHFDATLRTVQDKYSFLMNAYRGGSIKIDDLRLVHSSFALSLDISELEECVSSVQIESLEGEINDELLVGKKYLIAKLT